jgi:hypothetical protein
VITFRLRVRTTEFDVLADALASEMADSCLREHECDRAVVTSCTVNGKRMKLQYPEGIPRL